jgi:hypothetical protein
MGSLAALLHFNTCVFPAPSFEPFAALQAIHEERFFFNFFVLICLKKMYSNLWYTNNVY